MDLATLGNRLNFVSGRVSYDDEIGDRISHWWTSLILVVFAVLMSASQYVGSPIKCWFPQEFVGYWKQYAHNYCFIKSTYFVPPDYDYLPSNVKPHFSDSRNNTRDNDLRQNDARENMISYYQWAPYVLLVFASLFYFPRAIWRFLNWQTGVNVQTILTMSCDVDNIKVTKRRETIKTISQYMHESLLRLNKAKHATIFKIFTRKLGNYLTYVYLFVKLLYIANIVMQFFLIHNFIGSKYPVYSMGFGMLSDILQGNDWSSTGHFPRITMCDFSIRDLGDISRKYTVQCVLMINLFNEKIFIFIWLWYVFVFIVTIGSFGYWVSNMFLPNANRKFIYDFFEMKQIEKEVSSESFNLFMEKYLRSDGMLILRLVNLNAGEITACELVTELWQLYKENEMPLLKRYPSFKSNNSLPSGREEDSSF